MIVAKIANSNNDEYYTPKYAVKPILKYIKKDSVIWCPFDTFESEFVKVLKEYEFDVIYTHIDNGEDFFNIEIPFCDYIISNPPYSKKFDVLKKLFEIGKPFAMLVGVVGLFDSSKKAELFNNNKFEIMYLNPRVNYFNKKIEKIGNVPYQSVYICSNMLPKQIVFEKLEK